MKRLIFALIAAIAIPAAAHAELVMSSLSVGVAYEIDVNDEIHHHDLTLDAIYIGKPAVEIQPFHSVSINETRNWTTGPIQGTFTESLSTFVEFHPLDNEAYSSAQAEVTDFTFTIGSFLTLTGDRMRSQQYEMLHDGISITGNSMDSDGLSLRILGNAVTLGDPLTQGDVLYDQDGLLVRYGLPADSSELYVRNGLFITLDNFQHDGKTYNGYMLVGGADARILENPVPEPASLLALGLGGLGIIGRRRR